jgi:hypothetical protein
VTAWPRPDDDDRRQTLRARSTPAQSDSGTVTSR